ncbi:hypothetical protein SCHPADRAFT_885790 [Schizopora paradoxa]|uniref:Uncharacterized protein n=1 Tax=Schizopora paradoxa TaxID=27342 RepID=A0A0H2S3T5_9AGAM|nr:hypothetical protein SCHPADRAFT_885790 [Schizopora paradoxa]
MPLDHLSLPREIGLCDSAVGHSYEQYTPKCWVDGGQLFVAFHLKSKPVIPPYSSSSSYRTDDISRLHWIKDGYPYLAFLPYPMDCRGALLSRFAVDESHIPIYALQTEEGNRFAMETSLVASWERMEIALMRVARILIDRTGIPSIFSPPPPNCTTLHSTKKDRAQAVSLAMQVKDRFLPWFALVSFCIALLEQPALFLMNSGKEEIWPIWVGTLLISNLHPEWVGMLVDSCLSQFHRPHLGTTIKFDHDPNALYVGVMVDHQVPVVYIMDPRAVDDLPPAELRKLYYDMFCTVINRNATIEDLTNWMKKYTPPRNILSFLLASNATCDQPPHARSSAHMPVADHENQQFLFDDSVVLDDMIEPFPSLDDSSGQRSMETRIEFFSRRDQENEAIVANESEQETRRREHRARAMSNHQVPGRNSKTKVFLWVWVNSYEVRSKQIRGMFETLWTIYGSHEMKFDSVRNEWDLWSSDRKSVRPKQREFGERFEGSIAPNLAPSGETAELTNHDVSLKDVLRQDVVEIFEGACSKEKGARTDQSISHTKKVPLQEMMQSWYGLVLGGGHENKEPTFASQSVQKTYDKLSGNNRLRAILVDSVSPPFPHEATLVRLFLASLITGTDVPKKMLDVSFEPIDRFGNPSIEIRRSQYEAQAVSHADSPTIRLYSIRPLHKPERAWRLHLFVWDATTAVAIKRLPPERTATLELIAIYLLERGMHFLLGVPRGSFGAPLNDARVATMGRRWRGYCPDEADYASYRQKCRELFSIDRVRRALRRGGIIWRIALDYIEVLDGVDGPSQEVMNEPLWISDSASKRPVMVDDGLSVEEIGIIVGSYEIRDRYWTPDCEDWFVNTQRRYEVGDLALARVEEWKARLKRFRETKKLRHAIEGQCESFLTLD